MSHEANTQLNEARMVWAEQFAAPLRPAPSPSQDEKGQWFVMRDCENCNGVGGYLIPASVDNDEQEIICKTCAGTGAIKTYLPANLQDHD